MVQVLIIMETQLSFFLHGDEVARL